MTLIDAWFEHIAAIQERGLFVKTAHGREVLTYPAAVQLKDLQAVEDKFDMGFIAVQSFETDWAAACLHPYVKPEGVMCRSSLSTQHSFSVN